MFCSECGAKNPDDAAFCSECGKKLEKPQKSASINENSTPQNTQYQKVEEVQNVQNEQNAYVQNNQNKKSLLLKVVIIIVLLAILGGAIYFAYTKYFKDGNNSFLGGTTTKAEWGNKYFVYLKDVKNEKDKTVRENNYGIPENAENLKIQFIDIPTLINPIMVLNYTLEEKEYALIYYINKDKEISYIKYDEETNIEYLYNIEAKTYSWYIHSNSNGKHTYNLLEKEITDLAKNIDLKENVESNAQEEIVFTQNDIDTKNFGETKYNQTFIEPKMENESKVDLNLEVEDKELKNEIDSAVEEYKPEEELVSEENKKIVDEQVKYIEDKINNPIQAGDFTLQYGIYKQDLSDVPESIRNVVDEYSFEIRNDRTYEFTKVKKTYIQGTGEYKREIHKEVGTYMISEYDSRTYTYNGVELTTPAGYYIRFIIDLTQKPEEGYLGGNDLFYISGDNKFEGNIQANITSYGRTFLFAESNNDSTN